MAAESHPVTQAAPEPITPARAVPLTLRSTLMLVVAAAGGLLAFGWPLILPPGADATSLTTAVVVLGLTVPVLMGLVIAELTSTELDVKALAMLGILTAIGAVVRPLGAGTAGIEFVFFLLILGPRVFGPGFGFILGTTTLFASALITGGVGPWLPYQMIASGFVGLGAGLLPRFSGGRWLEIVMLAAYGAVSAFAYGMVMDFAFWPFAVGGGPAGFDPQVSPAENIHRFLVVNMVTGMGWNTGRAITNVVTIIVLGPPILQVLRRASRRARFE